MTLQITKNLIFERVEFCKSIADKELQEDIKVKYKAQKEYWTQLGLFITGQSLLASYDDLIEETLVEYTTEQYNKILRCEELLELQKEFIHENSSDVAELTKHLNETIDKCKYEISKLQESKKELDEYVKSK